MNLQVRLHTFKINTKNINLREIKTFIDLQKIIIKLSIEIDTSSNYS